MRLQANSSWTAAHLRNIWGIAPVIVHPPCPTAQFASHPLQPRGPLLVAVAQFRYDAI